MAVSTGENKTGKGPLGLTAATSIVVANMIGTGVFTTLSFQVHSLPSVFPILMLWLAGGIAALCGALCYSELASALPRSGGEYNFLTRIYHPILGFLSGWVSLIAGFAAPVALAAFALSEYLDKIIPGVSKVWIAATVVVLISLLQSISVRVGGIFQSIFTLMKISLIIFLILAGLFSTGHHSISLGPVPGDWAMIMSAGFASSLVYVSFAYSGWNAASYITGEIKNPLKNVPRALIMGTAIVTILYLLLNAVFLLTVPMQEMVSIDMGRLFNDEDVMKNELAVGFLAGKSIFGTAGAKIISGFVVIGLISTISAMVIAGPRVTARMGEDFSVFRFISKKAKGGAPVISIGIQLAISLFLIFTSTFNDVITYIGITLSVFATLTVLGVIILRIREPKLERPYKTLLFPVTPIIFIAINVWMIFYLVHDNLYRGNTQILYYSAITLLSGLVVYFIAHSFQNKNDNSSSL